MRAAAGLSILVVMSLAACSSAPPVDLTKGIQLIDVSSGWHDDGVVNGLNKLSPSISLKVKNVSEQTLLSLQVNALFRRVNEPDEWGSGFAIAAGSEGLAPAATTGTIVITSQHGYTGSEPRLDIMKNARFIDAKVELFAKYGSVQWTRLGEYPITRRLIEQ